MLKEIITLFTTNSGFFIELLREHIFVSFVSIIIATVLGIGIGIWISERPKVANIVLSVVNVLYTIPAIALFGFLISLTGIGNTTAIVALTIYALLPMVRSTYTGIHTIDPLIVEAAEGMGSTPSQILFKIKLPLALPVLMSGLRNMVTMTIALAGIASFVGAGGLGVSIYRGITTNNKSLTIAGSLLIALLALFCDYVLGWMEKRVSKKKRADKLIVTVLLIILLTPLLMSGIFRWMPNMKTVKLATKPITESYILGEIIAQLIEGKTDIDVKVTHGIGGGTSNIHPAMIRGDFDMYPEYTGTIWQIVLKKNEPYDESKFPILQKEYEQEHQLLWANLFGFNDTYSLAVRRELAEEYNLKTFTDLKRVADKLIFGAEYDFYEREDGFSALVSTYGLNFKQEIDMDNGLKYQAMKDKKIDVMTVFTTDGQLSTADVVVLEDDMHLYPSYLAGTVVRSEVLITYPELTDVLGQLDDVLDDKEMSRLNNEVETGGRTPEEVAKEFLIQKRLLEVGE